MGSVQRVIILCYLVTENPPINTNEAALKIIRLWGLKSIKVQEQILVYENIKSRSDNFPTIIVVRR